MLVVVLMVTFASCEAAPPRTPGATPTPVSGALDAPCVGEPSEVAAIFARDADVAGGDLWVMCTDGATAPVPAGDEDAVEARAVSFHPRGHSAVFERRDGAGGSVIVEVDLTDGRVTELGPGQLPAYAPDGRLAWGQDLVTDAGTPRLLVGDAPDDPELAIDIDEPAPPQFVPVADELLWTPDGGLVLVSRWAAGLWGVAVEEGARTPVEAETDADIFYAALAPAGEAGRLTAVRFEDGEPPVAAGLGTVAYTLEPGRFRMDDFRPVADLTTLPEGGVGPDPGLLVVSWGGGLDAERDGDTWRWSSTERSTWFVSDGFRTWVVREDGSGELFSGELGPVWVNPGAR